MLYVTINCVLQTSVLMLIKSVVLIAAQHAAGAVANFQRRAIARLRISYATVHTK